MSKEQAAIEDRDDSATPIVEEQDDETTTPQIQNTQTQLSVEVKAPYMSNHFPNIFLYWHGKYSIYLGIPNPNHMCM